MKPEDITPKDYVRRCVKCSTPVVAPWDWHPIHLEALQANLGILKPNGGRKGIQITPSEPYEGGYADGFVDGHTAAIRDVLAKLNELVRFPKDLG